MGIPRYAATTDENQADIVRGLRACGCSVVYLKSPVDLEVGYKGHNYLLEVKRPKAKGKAAGKKTDEQKKFFESWRGQVAVVSTLDEALRVVGVIQTAQEGESE